MRSLQTSTEIRFPLAWLHRIVHHVALNEIERQIETYDQLDEGLADHRSVASTAEQRLEVGEVLQSLASLPQRQRLALLGTELEGRSRRQLGLSEGAIRQLVHRARSSVRAAAHKSA